MIRTALKRALIGPPLATTQLLHERISKLKGLAVFSSDALSSTAYATEEILIVLVMAGAAAVGLALPVAIAISAVLAIVAFSYYQTIHAYPSGGGAYIVAHDNLGVWPGLVAAAALLIDYVLTVSVSVAAGIAAVTSAVPTLFHMRVSLALLAIALVAMINLRGVRESATIFAVPTYLFIGALGLTVIAGTARAFGQPPIPPHLAPGQSLAPISLWLILRAYASGSAAMTGVEAISNGIPAFRPPEARNAGITLIWMAGILIVLFLGLTFLAHQLGIVPQDRETVVSQIARAIFGTGPFYFLVQLSTALILILAANTSFADFPRLASILARDAFLPRALANLGDRLVFANGIVELALLSGGLVYVFRASTHALIPLYAVGVFLSFTLSQAGMVKRWWTRREHGWGRHMVINGGGATVTAIAVAVDIDPQRTRNLKEKWERWGMGVPLRVLSSPYRSVLESLLRFLDGLEWETGFDQQITVVLPEFVPVKWWHFFLHGQTALLLKLTLYFRRRQGHRVTVVTDVPYYLSPAEESVAAGGGGRPPPRRSGPLAGVSALFVAVGVLLGVALMRGWPQVVVEVLGLSLVVLLATLAFIVIIQSFLS